MYVVAGLVVLVVGVIGLWSLRGGDGAGGVVVEAAGDGGGSGDSPQALVGGLAVETVSSETTTTTQVPRIWVQVAGAVRRPGVYQVEAGARVFEAVLAAGGFADGADEQGVALAASLTDGCRLYVPLENETAGQVVANTRDAGAHRVDGRPFGRVDTGVERRGRAGGRARVAQHRHGRATRHSAGSGARTGSADRRLPRGERPLHVGRPA